MAMMASHAVPLPEPADDSHLPDAVSRPNLVNGTHWYDEPALASSPILKNEDATALRDTRGSQRNSNASTLRTSREIPVANYDRPRDSKGSDPNDFGNDLSPVGDPQDATEAQNTSDLQSVATEESRGDNDSGGEESVSGTPMSVRDLSTRADMIMANARRRLNLVDGGLKGARSSLLLSPSTSSLDSTSGTGSPSSPTTDKDGALMRSKSMPKPFELRFAPSRHKRLTSDTALTSASGAYVQGSRSLERLRDRDITFRPPLTKSLQEGQSPADLKTPSQNEQGTTPSTDRRRSGLPVTVGGGLSFPIPPRAQSLAFRDLQSRANNVSGRISTLRQRNREDAERRKSLQLSRPTTASSVRSMPITGSSEEFETPSSNGEESAEFAKTDEPNDGNVSTESATDATQQDQISTSEGDQALPDYYANGEADGSRYVEDEYYENDEDTDFYSIMEEPEYEDDEEEVLPFEGAHEDRADAFDYESFILSSLTGSLDKPRSSSISSSDSGSTTRGPVGDEDEYIRSWNEFRQSNISVNSISTMQSFATANEGDDESESGSDGFNEAWPMPPSSGQTSYSHTRESSGETVQEQPAKRPASMMLSALMGADKTSPALALSQDDQALVYTMAESIRDICMRLAGGASGEGEVEVWRKRLDEARRVLAGQETA